MGTSISYIVDATPTPITEDTPTGPSYLLNALSNTGCWYQVGVEWKWSGDSSPDQFQVGYNIFCDGKVVFPVPEGPCDEEGGDENFTRPVNPGDKVELTIKIIYNEVYMTATDLNTGATANLTYSAEGAVEFVGTPLSATNNYGEFTGLMTEQYFPAPYYGNAGQEIYTPVGPSPPNPQAWTGGDEFQTTSGDSCTSTTEILYVNDVDFPINPMPYYIQTAYNDGSGPGEEYFGNGTLITGVNEIAGPSFSYPLDVVFSPDGLYAYVVNQGSDTVSVVDVDEGAIVNTISLDGQDPSAIAMAPNGDTLYVAVGGDFADVGTNFPPSQIDIIDTVTRTITGSIAIPAVYPDNPASGPYQTVTDMVVNPAGTYLFSTAGYIVGKIDLASNTFVGAVYATTPISSGCSEVLYNFANSGGGMAIDPTGSYVYVDGDYVSWANNEEGINCTNEALTWGGPTVAQVSTSSLDVDLINCEGCNAQESFALGPIAISSSGSGYYAAALGPGSYLVGVPGGTTETTGELVAGIAFSPSNSGSPPGGIYTIHCDAIKYQESIVKTIPGTDIKTTGYFDVNGADVGLPDCPVTSWGGNSGNAHALAIDPNPDVAEAYIADYYNNQIIVVNTTTDAVGYIYLKPPQQSSPT